MNRNQIIEQIGTRRNLRTEDEMYAQIRRQMYSQIDS